MHTAPTTVTHVTTTDSGARPLTGNGNRAVTTYYLAGDSAVESSWGSR